MIGRFMRAMAEAAKIMHTDKDLTFRVLQKYLRVDDRKLLEASYNVEIKALEPRLALKPEGVQSTLDEIAPIEPRAKNVKPQEMADLRFLDEMERAASWNSCGEEGSRREKCAARHDPAVGKETRSQSPL